MLRKNKITSKQLEKLVGHFTSIALLRGESLAVLRAVCSFCHANYRRPKTLWPAVRRELRWMRRLLPLLATDVTKPISLPIVAMDASPCGAGVCTTVAATDAVSDTIQYNGRWRLSLNSSLGV